MLFYVFVRLDPYEQGGPDRKERRAKAAAGVAGNRVQTSQLLHKRPISHRKRPHPRSLLSEVRERMRRIFQRLLTFGLISSMLFAVAPSNAQRPVKGGKTGPGDIGPNGDRDKNPPLDSSFTGARAPLSAVNSRRSWRRNIVPS